MRDTVEITEFGSTEPVTTRTEPPRLEEMVDPGTGNVLVIGSGFPIAVISPTGTLEETRVAIIQVPGADDYAFAVWTRGSGNGPVLHSLDWVNEIQQISRGKTVITLSTGDVVQYQPSRKCGCGSRLRGYKPWGDGVRLVSAARPELPWVYSS